MYDLLASASVTKTTRLVSSVLFLSAAIFGGFFVSTAYAAITNIILTDPLGGEEWRGTQNITWTYTDNDTLGGPVSILLSSDGGLNYNTLVTGVPVSNPSYAWNTVGTPNGSAYKIRVIDPATTLAFESAADFMVDNLAPVTTEVAAPLTPNGLGGWYTTAPTITLSCADGAGSGCNNTYYKWDNATLWTTYVAPFAALESEHILSFYSDDQATDASGSRNEEIVQTKTIKVDTTFPTVAVTSTTGNGFYNEPDAINITLTFSEAVSSTNTLTVNLDSGGSCSVPILTNTTTGTCTYTIGAGQNSSDLTVTTIASGVVEDIAGNDSTLVPTSNLAATSAIVIDTTAPFPFAVGAVVTVGAPVVVGWWNSTNTGVNVVVPVDNTDLSLVGGTIQLIENNGGGPMNVGNAYTITAPDVVAGTKTLSLTAVEVEGGAGVGEGGTPTFSAIIPDVASNGATGTARLNTFVVDQTAPTVGAGTDKEVNATVAQDAAISDGGSGINTYNWTKTVGTGTVLFSNPNGTGLASDPDTNISVTDVSPTGDNTYTLELSVTDIAGNSASDTIQFAWDTIKPVLAQVTAVPNPTNDTTPSYTFSVDSIKQLVASGGGTIGYTGACGICDLATAVVGSNTTTYTVTANVTYTNCDITVTDAAGNTSLVLEVNNFEADTIAALISSVTTEDTDFDGSIDKATLVFNDEINDSTIVLMDFSIAGTNPTAVSTGTTPNDTTIILTFVTEIPGTEAKTLNYTSSADDLAGNDIAPFSKLSIDAAKPVLLSARTISTTQITATFSENLDGCTVNDSGNEFTVAGTIVTAASETADGVVTLTYAPALSTGATPVVTYTSNGPLNDLAIPANTATTPVSVTAVDGVSPTLSAVTISSNNDGDTVAPEWAIVGNTAPLTFTSSEPIAIPTVLLDGMSASVSNTGNDWTATYTFIGGEADGTIPFSIAFADVAVPAPNAGTTVTVTGDGSTVFFDEVNPTVNAGTDKEVNAPSAQDAAISDAVPPLGSGLNTWTWSQVSGPGTASFAPLSTNTDPNLDPDVTISADTDGTYVLKLTVTDHAGNSNEGTLTFIWDTTNPEPLTASPSDGAPRVAIAAGPATVTTEQDIVLLDSSRVLLVNDSTGASYKGVVAVSGGNGASAILNIDYSGLAYGTKYRVNVKPNALEDVAGNNLASNFISYFTTVIDTIPPVVNSFSASAITTTGATLNVTTNEGATCKYAATDSAYASMTAMTSTGDTSHSQAIIGLAPSTGYAYFVRCQDTGGNVMTTSGVASFTTADPAPDTAAPPVPIITTASPVTVNSNTYVISGTVGADTPSDGMRTVIVYNGASSAGTASVATGQTSFAVIVTLVQNTANNFTAKAADSAGNGRGASHLVTITDDDTLGADTTAPDAPAITTANATVDADTYAISGTAANDGGTRIITVYRNSTPVAVGSTALAAGETDWSMSVPLNQNAGNTFNARSIDEVGNESAESNSVTITEATADTTAPTVSVSVGSITTTSAIISITSSETASCKSDTSDVAYASMATTLLGGPTSYTYSPSGLAAGTTYNYFIRCQDSAGNISDSAHATFTTLLDNAAAALHVDGITNVKTAAIADNTYPNGYVWTFRVTVPSTETNFFMKFTDFAGTIAPNTIAAANNVRYYSAQSSNANTEGTAVGVTGNDYPAAALAVDTSTDLDSATAGIQIDVRVQVKVPTGTAADTYSGSYGIKTTI